MTYKVQIKDHPSTRKISLRFCVLSRSVIITKPVYTSKSKALDFYKKNQVWVQEKFSSLEVLPFEPNISIPFFDQKVQIIHHDTQRGVTSLKQNELHVFGLAESVGPKVRAFLKRAVKDHITQLVEEKALKIGKPYGQIRIKETSSRWGSCSTYGNLNFSWRLVFMPLFVVDYIVAHEVSHLVHAHHQTSFWALTDQLCERSSQAQLWLKKNGRRVLMIG